MVMLEAMAFAKPVVATAVGGVPEILENGFNGFGIDKRDPTLVASALLRVLKDDILRHRLSQNSRRRYEERFTAQTMAADYQRLYERYLEKKKVQAA